MVNESLPKDQANPDLRLGQTEQFSFGQFRLIQGTLALDASLSSLLLFRTYRSGLDLKRLKGSICRTQLRDLVAFLRRERSRFERQIPGLSGLPKQMEVIINRRFLQGLEGKDPVKLLVQISGSRAVSPRKRGRASPHAYLEGLAVALPPFVEEGRKALLARESSIDLQGEFLRRMSHELRTPLHAICGITQILSDKESQHLSSDDGEARARRRLLEQLLAAGEQMQDLVSQLLDLTYVRNSKLSNVPQPFNLNELLIQCWQPYFARSEEKGVSFEYESDLEEETFLLGDWRLLFQLIRLLLSNAVKFTDRGKVVLSVRHTAISRGYFELNLEVSDTGIGIEPEDVERIFEPFTQGSTGDQRSHGGSGLGLYLCEQIAQALGSHVTIIPKPGFSTCFALHINFPRASAKSIQEPRVGASGTNFDDWRLDSRRDPLRVLVVDDNELNLSIVKAFLRNTEVLVTAVTSGQEAIAEFSSDFYDVVLMDLQMPEMDGYQTTARMRHIERAFSRERSLIIAVSASCFSEDVAKARASGCDDHIAKPLSRGGLFAALNRHKMKLHAHRVPPNLKDQITDHSI